MSANWKSRMPLALVAGLVVAALVVTARWQPVRAEREGAPAGTVRYTVVDTEGHNLIVTDNQTDTLYFYTIDRDGKIGDDLKLRGSLDLNQVGKPTLKPRKGEVQD